MCLYTYVEVSQMLSTGTGNKLRFFCNQRQRTWRENVPAICPALHARDHSGQEDMPCA